MCGRLGAKKGGTVVMKKFESAFLGASLANADGVWMLLVIWGLGTSGSVRLRILVFYFMAGCLLTIFTKGYYARCCAKWFQTDGEFKGNMTGCEFGC